MRDAHEAFGQACRKREALGTLAGATAANYWDDLADFAQLVGFDMVVDDITGDDVTNALIAYSRLPDRRYAEPRSRPKAWLTQDRFRRSVAQFFAHAETHGWVQMSPMAFVTNRRRPDDSGVRVERRSLYLPQAEALLEHGPGRAEVEATLRPHERNVARDTYMLTLMLTLGPRVSEVVNADRDDISDTGSGSVWHIVGKGKKKRVLPLTDELLQLRAQYEAARPAPAQSATAVQREDAIRAEFLTGRGQRMAARDVQRMVQRAHQRVSAVDPGLARGVTPHALRHTAATLLLASGWDVKVVRDLLGHSSIATTSRYLDELDDELAAAVRAHPLLRSVPKPSAL